VTTTREKLLDMADCYAAMDYGLMEQEARLAASKLAPSAPDDAPRAFKVGDLVCPVPGEYRAGEVGTVRRETTRANAPVFMVEFPNRDHCAYAAHELTHADSPDDEGLSEIHAALDMGAAVLRTSHMPSLAKTLDAHRERGGAAAGGTGQDRERA
jgi:hypothetical protein